MSGPLDKGTAALRRAASGATGASTCSPPPSHQPLVEQEEIVIGVMGTTGAGKSKFIKTLTGDQNIVEGRSLQSCTQRLDTYLAVHKNQRIVFVDTPGFDDTNRKDTDILKQVAVWLSATYQANKRLSGIIYLHRIIDNRMAGSALRNLRVFRNLCGEKAMGNVVLATTHWDVVDQNIAVQRETELRNDFWKGMLQLGSRIERFDGSTEAAWRVVEPLLPMKRVVLNIQTQIVDKGIKISDTDAGKAVNEELLRAQKQHAAEIAELKASWKEATDNKDKELARILEGEKRQAEEKFNRLKKEQDDFMRIQIEDMKRMNRELLDKIKSMENQNSCVIL